MTKDELKKLSKDIEKVSNNFEDKPWTDNLKLLKEDFNIATIDTPAYYWEVMKELEEVLRETRLLYLFSVLSRVCKEEGQLYAFDTPYQASMRYDGVMKKEGNFYLQDEDGHYREIFASEKFTHFIDDLYWELYEE